MENRIINFILLLSLLGAVAFSPSAKAQPTYDLRFQTQVSEGDFIVTVQIRTDTGTDDLGSSNLVFVYNDGALDYTPVDGTTYTFLNFDNDVQGNYINATVTKTVLPGPADRLSLNIELNVDNQGTVVTSAYMDIARLRFAITDATAFPGLFWEPGYTEAFDGDNATLWTKGALEDGDNVPLPVELASFTAIVRDAEITLQWSTVSEVNNAGFEVQHRFATDPVFEVLGFVEGRGTTTEPQAYTYVARGLDPGRHIFRLKQVDFDGAFEFSSETELSVALLESFALEPPYPNPFTGQATFRFAVREATEVQVELFNVLGQRVQVLYTGTPEPGQMLPVVVDGQGLASGLYFVRLIGDNIRAHQRLVLTR